MNQMCLHMDTPGDEFVNSSLYMLPFTLGSKTRSPDMSMQPGTAPNLNMSKNAYR